MKDSKYFNLQMFANANVQTTLLNTTGNDLSPEMKVFYKTTLLENLREENYFNQFGKKQPLPKNGGKSVEFRRFEMFAPATTALTEGVTPDGSKLNIASINAPIDQYGDYTTISDRLEMEAVDPIITETTEEHGANAGTTLDILTRNALIVGTNVYYGGDAEDRSELTPEDTLTSTLANRAATWLKKMHAPKINGSYIGIVHPSCSYDLRESPGWIEAHKYASPDEIYNGEIGKLHGIRFIETSNVKVVKAGAVNDDNEAAAVYENLFFGRDAYGIIEPTAEALEVIVKALGSGGTNDPLNQRSTVGWKASHGAKIIYPERILRVEVGSSFSYEDEEN